MLLTPRDVHDARFEVRGFGPWRGYDTDQVDALLDQVETTLMVLRDELLVGKEDSDEGTILGEYDGREIFHLPRH